MQDEPSREGLMDDIRLDHQVFVYEISGIAIVGEDAAHLCCGQNDHVRTLCLHKVPHCRLIGQVQLGMGSGDDVRLATRAKLAQDRAADHALVA